MLFDEGVEKNEGEVYKSLYLLPASAVDVQFQFAPEREEHI